MRTRFDALPPDVQHVIRQAAGFHDHKLLKWWTDAAKLEADGKTIPAGTLRRRMQELAWAIKPASDLYAEYQKEICMHDVPLDQECERCKAGTKQTT